MQKLVGLVKIVLLVGLILFSKAYAKDLGTVGILYEIGESDLLQELKSHLNELQKTGKLDQLNQDITRQAQDSIEHPKSIEGVHPTTNPKIWIYDPTITAAQDISDQNGNILVKAGTKINPLTYVSLKDKLLFIQGDDAAQVAWALAKKKEFNQRVKIILTQGSPIKLMQQLKTQFYFDQDGNLSHHFSITQNPAMIEQKDLALQISEVRP